MLYTVLEAAFEYRAVLVRPTGVLGVTGAHGVRGSRASEEWRRLRGPFCRHQTASGFDRAREEHRIGDTPDVQTGRRYSYECYGTTGMMVLAYLPQAIMVWSCLFERQPSLFALDERGGCAYSISGRC